MNWESQHRRGDILREVIRCADERRDGHLPMEVEGVAATFRDDLTLLGALLLRWHTRLAGRIEREIAEEPLDLDNAVTVAWLDTAADMPGIRAIIDQHVAHPTSVAMTDVLARASSKEHEMLALMSGRADSTGEAAVLVGRAIELGARASYVPRMVPEPAPPTLVQRLKAALAA